MTIGKLHVPGNGLLYLPNPLTFFMISSLTTALAIVFQRCTAANTRKPQLRKRSWVKFNWDTYGDAFDLDNHGYAVNPCNYGYGFNRGIYGYTFNPNDYGYAMVDSCPAYNTDKNLESLCTTRSSEADLFGMLPVSDLKNQTAYKNEFCARCNQATNLTYWTFSAK